MPSRHIKKNGMIIDTSGAFVREVHSQNDKCYAVIVKCGHCGDGYYIPIMFTTKCKDMQTAIEYIKTNPMVKRDRKDCVLAAFEVTPFERFCIESINDHDPYLKGYLLKKTPEIDERKVAGEEIVENINKTDFKYFELKMSDEYDSRYVLERYFAPYCVGSDLIFPKKVDTQQLLHDFFQRACIRYGMKKEKPFFLGLYYQLYGENNDLKIIKDGNCFYYKKYGEIVACEIPDTLIKQIESNIQVTKMNKEEPAEEYFSGKPVQRKSQAEKFNDRFKKYQELNGQNQQEPGRE